MSTYYISTTGNDLNPGTIDKPFRNFEKISSLALVAGDIVWIRAGTYASTAIPSGSSGVYITGRNGNASSHIIISAYPGDFPNGGRVVYDMTNKPFTQNCLGIWSCRVHSVPLQDI
jgi:hypothetical protein